MGRRNRRQPDPRGDAEDASRFETREDGPDGAWSVRAVPGAAATKAYRCPGCDHEVRPGIPHVVAWPADGIGGPGDRRHWHTACWQARLRRAPRVQRSRDAPRY